MKEYKDEPVDPDPESTKVGQRAIQQYLKKRRNRARNKMRRASRNKQR